MLPIIVCILSDKGFCSAVLQQYNTALSNTPSEASLAGCTDTLHYKTSMHAYERHACMHLGAFTYTLNLASAYPHQSVLARRVAHAL